MSKSLCFRGCLHTSIHPQVSTCRRRSDFGQPGSCWFLHQHRSRPIHWSLVHASRFPSTPHECVRQRGLSRKDQQSRGHHQRPYLPSPERHQEDHHQGCPGFAPVSTEYADVRSGAPMSSTESGQPHGQSTVTGTLPHGCIH